MLHGLSSLTHLIFPFEVRVSEKDLKGERDGVNGCDQREKEHPEV